MTTDVISPGEAWEAVERLKLDVGYNKIVRQWSAVKPGKKWESAFGATPLEAVANLLARIGEAAQKAEAANG